MKSPTCTILYELILATIRKSGLYDFIRMAYSQPQFDILEGANFEYAVTSNLAATDPLDACPDEK